MSNNRRLSYEDLPWADLATECRGLLANIASGVVAVTPEEVPKDQYRGNLTFTCSNGWKVVVFNNCDEFGYIDLFEDPNGHRLEFDEMCADHPDLAEYSPSQEELASRWGWK